MIFLNNLACVILFALTNVKCEWIEIPEFSDNSKVYRIPIRNYNQQPKIIREHDQNHYPFRNMSTNFLNDYDTRIDNIFKINNKNQTFQTLNSKEFSPIKLFKQDSNENINKFESLKENSKSNASRILQDPSILLTEAISNITYNNKLLSHEEKSNNTDFLEYIPIDIIKRVHLILKSQSVTIKGKFEYLKAFEHIVLKEIEARLQNCIAPRRKKRGSEHYDHGYDDHEEGGLGFPSIEGALMAISFLTFAVYLVRLVMMLFRNMSNIPPANNGATVFFGKKKRSLDLNFNDDTVRILNGVDNFMARYR